MSHGIVIDGERLGRRLAALATIGSGAGPGVTREAFGPEDVEARTLVATWMDEAGLDVHVDAASNLVGRRPGCDPDAGFLASGSHLDTVVDAGPLDGAYGVVAAVEAADAVHRAGHPLVHELMVLAFANEEGARGSDGMLGSRALVGEVPPEELTRLDDEGVSIGRRLAEAGGDPGRIDGAAWDPAAAAAFVEVHIEQGPVLDAGGHDLGAVTAITGRQTVDIDLIGRPNHAGTTPMDLRQDALVAGAEVVVAIEKLATSGAVRVATCGHLAVAPNVRNVIPGQARLSAELRDTDDAVLAAARSTLEGAVHEIGRRRGVAAAVTWGQLVPPVRADGRVLAAVRDVARRSGSSWCDLPSGAGHDAQILARHVPAGMIFVPSVGGVSHSPEETTDPVHLVGGAEALLDTLLALDRTAP